MSDSTLILYSTLGCHLCEHAKVMIVPQLPARSLQLQEVDIADDDELMARYGVSIPVLVYSERSLYWPFNDDELQTFLDVE